MTVTDKEVSELADRVSRISDPYEKAMVGMFGALDLMMRPRLPKNDFHQEDAHLEEGREAEHAADNR